MKKIKYKEEPDLFFSTLKQRVDQYFIDNNITKFGNNKLYFKVLFLATIYFGLYCLIYIIDTKWIPLIYILMGAEGIILGLNIGHDAAHNAVFKSVKLNKIALFGFDLLGTNGYNWKNRHIYAHHPYPNIADYDSDIQQTKIVRIFPQDKHLWFHKYQMYYMPLLYMVYILRWIIYRDFEDFAVKRIGAYQNKKFNTKEFIRLVFFKLLYFSYVIIVPYIFLDLSIWYIILSFLLLTASGSLTVTLVLLSAHVGEDSLFPSPDKNGIMSDSWSYHQVKTTNDFATHNPIANFLFGGFNHHTFHHLFPKVCHIHYKKLTPILIKTAEEFGLKYNTKPYIYKAILSHFKLLKIRG